MAISLKKNRKLIFLLAGVIVGVVFLLISSLLYIKNSSEFTPPNYVSVVDSASLESYVSPSLQNEEIVVIEDKTTSTEDIVLPVTRVLFEYVEVVGGCGPFFEGECLNVRSGPSDEYPVVAQLRNGIVLRVGGQVISDDELWYKIIFDEWLRYPDRVKSEWYVSAEFVKVLLDEGEKTVWEHDHGSSTMKQITVDRTEQKLYAFEGSSLFMEIDISTGLELTPTPAGTFAVFKKTPTRYMQGPLPNLVDQQYYDLPGVPWNLYFTHGGAVIHGAYWHDSFGSAYSHGCVNVDPTIARKLYEWTELGTIVIVKN